VEAAYGLAWLAIQQEPEDAARDEIVVFVDAHPEHGAIPALLCRLVAIAIDRGEIDRAAEWVARLVRDHSPNDHVREPLRYFGAAAGAQPALRRRVYEGILARDVSEPLRLDAWFGLAEALLGLGEADGAQRAVEAFLRESKGADPRSPAAFALLVPIYEMQGRHGLALRTAESFLTRFPNAPATPYVAMIRGRLLVADGQWEAAQRSLVSARASEDPMVRAEAIYWSGEALRARGEIEGALAAYLEVRASYPGTRWAARGLQGAAQSYLARNEPGEAILVLRELVSQPAAEPALVEWARDGLRRLGDASAPSAQPRVPRSTAPKL
jgi:tetratricopeptide (TPR) repeat protein